MSLPKKVLLCCANTLVCQTLRELLACEGELDIDCRDRIPPPRHSDDGPYSAVVADLELLSDLEFLVHQRRSRSELLAECPLILLAPQNLDTDRQLPDDALIQTIVKPFRYRELLVHLLGMITMFEHSQLTAFAIGEARIDPRTSRCTEPSGHISRLTGKELKLLLCLYRAEGQILSRDHLLKAVWGYETHIITKTLDTHIHWLRQKIEPNPYKPRFLLTAAGGFRLSCSNT